MSGRMVLENLRNTALWVADALKGRQLRRHYDEITVLLESTDDRTIIAKINGSLDNLLKHSVKTVSFYDSYKDCGLTAFPVVNKTVIRASFASFLSSSYNSEELYQAITSGSTGTPFKIYQDRNKKLRNYADTLYFAGLAGYRTGHRLVYLKIWVKEKMKNPIAYRLQNIVPVDVIRFNEREIEALINRMEKDRSTFGLLGYSSALELICRYLDRTGHGPVKAEVKSIIAISETLNDNTRESLEKYFGVPAVSRYSNLENGIIAQQIPGQGSRYLVNSASYHVEILKMDSDEPAEEGEQGRIVVTDLFNYAMPMIRYDTGDIGYMVHDENFPWRKYLNHVEGRRMDLLYDTSGNLVSSYIVYKNMWQYTEIEQYQLIQEDKKRYTIKINCREPFTREQKLIGEFKSYLGQDADFSIENVTEIPLLSSGKRKKIVNNYCKV